MINCEKSEPSIQVSIVVACRNEIRHIHSFLDSVLAQEAPGVEWEAIIADGDSSDGTRAVLDERCKQQSRLRVIDNPARIVSTGLNEAIRAARGEIVLRMDVHTQYAPTYTAICLETLQSSGAENVGGPARTVAHGKLARAIAAAYHLAFSTGGAKFHDPEYEGWVDTVTYGCWRKSTLLSIGLFDEALIRNQDDELNLRLILSGGRIWQNPRILSWYTPRASLKSLFHQYFQYGFWKAAVIRKHRLASSVRHLVPAGFVSANIALLLAAMAAAMLGVPPARNIAAAVWLALAATYATASLVASIVGARRYGLEILPYLPAVFAAYHFSYGMGFLTGFCWFFSRPTGAFSGDSIAARITR